MAAVCLASALAAGNYLFDQPLRRRVALALRQADDFQVEGPEVEGQSEPLQRQERGEVADQLGRQHRRQFAAGDYGRGVAPVAGVRSSSARTRTIIR